MTNNQNFSREYELEEYKSLRTEILSQFQNRNNVLTFGSGAIGILFNAAAAVGKDVESPSLKALEYTASVVVLTVTVPLLTFLIIFLWGVYSNRVAMIGRYLLKKEGKVKGLGWENHLQTLKDSDEVRQAIAVTVIFTAIALTSVVFGIRIGSSVGIKFSDFMLCHIFSLLILLAGFLSGDYRIYRIAEGSDPEKAKLFKFPFYLLRKLFYLLRKLISLPSYLLRKLLNWCLD